MTHLRNYISAFMQAHGFPEDAQVDLVAAFDVISANENAMQRFLSLLDEYNDNIKCNYPRMLKDAISLGHELGIHEYTASLLLYICLSKRLGEVYAERGIDRKIFFDSTHDLYYKLIECRLVKGINGSFVAIWFSGFFDLARFALGRLQFEISSTADDVTIDGTFYPKGTKTLAVHIPRTGTRLERDSVLESYRLASEFFRVEFDGQPILFCCHSWMLDPWLGSVLSPSSNIVTFAKDYLLIHDNVSSINNVVWRVFDEDYRGDPYALSQSSSIRRAYADRIARGDDLIETLGFFVYENGNIINYK